MSPARKSSWKGLTLAGVIAAAVVVPAGLAGAAPSPSVGAEVVLSGYTGTQQTSTVPAGACFATITAIGGGGGGGEQNENLGGAIANPRTAGSGAAIVLNRMRVLPGAQIEVLVGEGGQSGNASGPANSGAGGRTGNIGRTGGLGGQTSDTLAENEGGGGGGATAVRVDGSTVLIAGGGGGSAGADTDAGGGAGGGSSSLGGSGFGKNA